MIKISVDKVQILHEIMTEETGGDPEIRDIALLESAVEGVFATFAGQGLYPTIEEKGARLGFTLISNHAFVDGNKRIGMYVMLIFLEINGAMIEPQAEEVTRVGFAVASGEMKYDELLSWVRDNRKR